MVRTEQQYFKVIKGKEKIILSAPRCVKHIREKSIRPRETKIGAIVRVLSEKYNTYGIYKSKYEKDDANLDKECKYKNYVREIVNKEK